MGKARKGAAVAALWLAIGASVGGLATVSASQVGNGNAAVSEDEYGWNCLTMGNGVCGLSLAHVPTADGGFGVVQPRGEDFGPTVAWWTGEVTTATPVEREAGWRACVLSVPGSDADMAGCDADWQVPGERFDMRAPSAAWKQACVEQAWYGDDPDDDMLSECEAA